MDWLEPWLGLSPDGGDDSVESIVVALAVLLLVILTRMKRRGATVRRAVGAAGRRLPAS